jgi:hypothetical protein
VLAFAGAAAFDLNGAGATNPDHVRRYSVQREGRGPQYGQSNLSRHTRDVRHILPMLLVRASMIQ